jgi:hypothetical protein
MYDIRMGYLLQQSWPQAVYYCNSKLIVFTGYASIMLQDGRFGL